MNEKNNATLPFIGDKNAKDLTYLRFAMTSIYVFTFLLSVVGNTIVIFILIKDRKMRQLNNIYSFSLSLSDTMIILFCLPVAVYELHYGDVWILGAAMCRLVPFLQYLSVNAEILTIVAIGVERFIIICQPLRARTMCTKRTSYRIVCGLWLLSATSGLPTFIYTDVMSLNENDANCSNSTKTAKPILYCIQRNGGEWLAMSHVIVFYVFPGIFLFTIYIMISKHLNKYAGQEVRMYSRENQPHVVAHRTLSRRTVHVKLTIIIVTYFLFLLPFNIVVTMAICAPYVLLLLNERSFIIMLAVVRALYFANATLNPILYTAISENFRNACARTFVQRRQFVGGQRNESLLYSTNGDICNQIRSPGFVVNETCDIVSMDKLNLRRFCEQNHQQRLMHRSAISLD